MGKWRYGVILDAGSSGTRVHIYRWLNAAKAKVEADDTLLKSLPVLHTKKKWTKKIHPGVSTFGEKPELVGSDHLAGLVGHALDVVPKQDVENTPIFLLATAGMRLLPDHQRNAVLDNICSYFQKNTKFQLPDCALHIQVIPGETEALYGWMAANYLLGGFDSDATMAHNHGKGHHTYGFLEMGGASAQIAFAPNATEAELHANDLKLLRMRLVSGEAVEYKVFVTTWLEYGVNEARRRYVEALLEASPDSLELPDPCLPSGLTVAKSGHVILPGSDEAKGHESHLIGTGKFTECLKRTLPLLDKEAACADPPCLFHGVHVPAIDFDVNHFVGVSEFWHTTHEVFEMAHKDKAYDFHTYQDRVIEFCSQDWAAIEKGIASETWGKKVDEAKAVEVCFKASWLINMLHEGIGIPRKGIESTKPTNGQFTNGTKAILEGAKEKGFLDAFQAVDKIDDTEVSWTLGKMLLYAASQVPPKDDTLAVGFGSNIPGNTLPKDFQFAGGQHTPLPDDIEGNDWHDKLFNSGSSRRIPGLLLFMLILVVAGFLLCGRERRALLFKRFLRREPHHPASKTPKKRKSLFNGKLFGGGLSSGPSYERLHEGGDQAELEMGDMAFEDNDSDTSVSPVNSLGRRNRGAGWPNSQTTKAGFDSPSLNSLSSPRSLNSHFESSHAAQPGLGIHAASAFDRGGLIGRTESRERLFAPANALNMAVGSGSRSRQSSPTRRSPLIAPYKVGRTE